MDNLSRMLKASLLKKGASLVGFADLKDMPEEKTQGFRYGISIAVALNPVIISGIEYGPTKKYYSEYLKLNNILDQLSEYASDILKSYGYNAFSCSKAARKLSNKLGIKDRICGKCIVVCPWTKDI